MGEDRFEFSRVQSKKGLVDAHYSFLYENCIEGMILTEPDGTILSASPQACRMFGMTEEEILTAGMDRLVVADEKLATAIKEREQTGQVKAELTFRRADGTAFPVEVTSRLFTNADGTIKTSMILRDITERKMMERELQKSEERFHTATDFTYDWEYWTGPDGNYVYISPSCERISGYSAEDFIMRPDLLTDIVHPEDRKLLSEHLCESAGGIHSLDFRIVSKYGEERWIAHVCQPVYSKDGGYLGRRISNRDITERKRAEEAYRVLVDSSLQGLIIFQGNRIVFINEACSMMVGYTIEEMLAMSFREIQEAVHPEDRAIVWGRFRDRFDGKSAPENYEFRMLRKDGSILWVEMHASLTRYQGKPAIQVAIIDITERKQAEVALRASHQVLDGIINAIPARVFWKDKDLVYLGCNAIFAHDAGFAGSKEIVGKDDYQMGWRDQAELYRADDRQVIDSGQPKLLIEEPQTTPGGDTNVILTSKIPLRGSEGEIIGVLGTYMDITERKRAEKTLLEQFNFLQQLIDSIPSPTYYRDINGVYLGCNKAFENLIATSKDKIVGHSIYELYPKDMADMFYEADNKLFQNPGAQVYEAAIDLANGSRRDLMFSKATYFDTEGQLAGLVGVILGITERKQMENALRESERRLADIINFLPDATIVIDRDGKVIAWNRATEALTCFKSEDILGKGNYEYALPFYGQRRPILIDLVLRPQDEVETGYSNLKRDGCTLVGESYAPMIGGEVYLWGVASALYDSQGNIVGAIESIKNITERKRSDETLMASLQEKEILLKEIHHRVKNNLQIVSSMLKIQSRKIQDKETADAFRDSQNRIRSMALVHEKLYRSQDLSKVYLNEYINKLAGDLIWSFECGKKVRFHSDLEEVSLGIDKAIPLGLILNELITNCLKHAFPGDRKGEIYVSLSLDGNSLDLTVSDNGIGMPEKFDINNLKSMGLMVVQALVKQLKGTLDIKVCGGTEFKVKINTSTTTA
jgi:PAS domain S-box-containing protein